MSFFLTSLTTPPGSWLQALFLLVVLEAPAALAFNRWWALRRMARGTAAPATARHRAAQGRLAMAAGLLFGLRALGLAAAVLIPAGTLDALVVLPPMERATSALTILLLLWALAFPDFSPWADVVATAAAGLLLAGLAVAWMMWDAAVAVGEPFYNGTFDETAWIIASAALLLVGLWLLTRRRTPGWRQGAALFGILLLGQALQYLFPIAGLDAPAAVRWAEALVLPAAMLLLYQRAQSWPIRVPAAAGAPLPADAAEAELPQAVLPKFGVWSVVRQLAETFLIAALVYFAIEFSSGRFKVDGPSMQPTLYAGQFVLTDKLAYRIGRPQRGDIVVIHPNDPRFVGGGLDLIKRVIGLPGETISVSGGVVLINGKRYLEEYPLEPARYTGTWIVGANQYFVLGDNRNNSSDSHVWGPLDRSKLAGRALLVYWPPSAWSWIAHTPLAAASP